MLFNSLLLQAEQAAEAASANADSGAAGGFFGSATMFLPLLLIILIMYIFMIRPQNKKQKEMQKMIAALKKGDKVVTIGGIHGTISQAKDKTVIVKVDDGTKIEFNRTAIASVFVEKSAAETSSEKTEKSEEK